MPSIIRLEEVPISKLVPLALYVLKPKLEYLGRLREAFLKQGIDILNLPEDKARITFNWGDQKAVVISPPLVEVSEDDGGLWVITDGLHRRSLAEDLGESSITSIVVKNTAAPLPFLPVRWDEVKRVSKTPPTSEKRKPRFKSPAELINWPKTSQRNYERFIDGFADPFTKLGLLHTFDPSKERKRFPFRASVAVVIQDKKGRLLLVQQASQRKGFKWGLPAGKINTLEDPKIAAVRETKEETDLDVELIDIVRIYPVSRGDRATSFGFVFRGKIKSGEIGPGVGEIEDCQYFSLEEIENLKKQGELYRPEYNIPSIEDWKKGQSYPLDIISSLLNIHR